MALSKITVETHVSAPLQKIWDCYTAPADIMQWNAASDDWHTTKAEVNLRVGGTFNSRMEAKDGSTGFDFTGTYTKIIDQSLIAYEFGERTAEITFEPTASGIVVRVSFDPETIHTHEQQRAGWQAILDNFKRYVETKIAG